MGSGSCSGACLCNDKAKTKPTIKTIGITQKAFSIPILSPSKEMGIAVNPANIHPPPSINELANPPVIRQIILSQGNGYTHRHENPCTNDCKRYIGPLQRRELKRQHTDQSTSDTDSNHLGLPMPITHNAPEHYADGSREKNDRVGNATLPKPQTFFNENRGQKPP